MRRLTDAERRDYADLTICFKAPLYDKGRRGGKGVDRQPFSGSPAQIVGDIETYARLGVDELIFDFRSATLSETMDRMGQFDAEIRSQTA